MCKKHFTLQQFFFTKSSQNTCSSSPADCRSFLDRHERDLASVLVVSFRSSSSVHLTQKCPAAVLSGEDVRNSIDGDGLDSNRGSPQEVSSHHRPEGFTKLLVLPGVQKGIGHEYSAEHNPRWRPKHHGHRGEESCDENPKNRLSRKNKNKAHCENVKAESLVLSRERIRKVVHDLEIQNTDSFHTYLYSAEDFKVAVHHNQSLSDDSKRKCTSSKPTGQNRHRCSLRKRSIFSIPTPFGRIPKGRDPREQGAQGDQPRSCDHPFGVSLLIQALIHSRGFGDQNVPVDRNKRVGEQWHGDSQKQQRFFERLVADHQKSPSGGDHCFVRHPESTNQQICHTAVHDKRITGCAELLERHHQIDHQEVEDGSQNTHEGVDCSEGDAWAASQSARWQRHVCVVWHDGRCADNVISSYRISHCVRNVCVRERSSLWWCCGGESRFMCVCVRVQEAWDQQEPTLHTHVYSLFPGCTITMKASNYS